MSEGLIGLLEALREHQALLNQTVQKCPTCGLDWHQDHAEWLAARLLGGAATRVERAIALLGRTD